MYTKNPNITFSKTSKIYSKESETESILYDTRMEAVHILNRTAYFIWQLCDGKHTLSDIEKIMRERFSVAKEYDLLGDIDQAVQKLLLKGLLVESKTKDLSDK